MINLVSLKQDLDSNRELTDIIEVFKIAAMIRFHTFQSKKKPGEECLKEVLRCFSMMTPIKDAHPYLMERPSLPSILMVVTSNEGFLGELNTLLIESALKEYQSEKDQLVVLGERGAWRIEEKGKKFVYFSISSDDVKPQEVEGIRRYLLKHYQKGYGRVVVIYPRFISVVTQRVQTIRLLPYLLEARSSGAPSIEQEILLEPTTTSVIEGIVELWMGSKLLEVLWSSRQSELAARIVHLEGSTRELSSLNQKLTTDYFKQLHAVKDRTIREIASTQMILAKNQVADLEEEYSR